MGRPKRKEPCRRHANFWPESVTIMQLVEEVIGNSTYDAVQVCADGAATDVGLIHWIRCILGFGSADRLQGAAVLC